MKNKRDRKKFLDTLQEIPIVSIAAKRAGISRSQIYRWRKKNKEFIDEMDQFLFRGRDTINDLAESHVINSIRNGNDKMTIFWLENNCKRYTKPRPVNYFNNAFGSDKPINRNEIVFKRMDGSGNVEEINYEEEERLGKINKIKERFKNVGGIPLKQDGTKIEDNELSKYEGYIEEYYKKSGKLFMEEDDYLFFKNFDDNKEKTTDTQDSESLMDKQQEVPKENQKLPNNSDSNSSTQDNPQDNNT